MYRQEIDDSVADFTKDRFPLTNTKERARVVTELSTQSE